MITWNGPFGPEVDINAGFVIKIKAIEKFPSDEKDFRDWISIKATEVGVGDYTEPYYDETTQQHIKVDFVVLLRELSIIEKDSYG